MKYKSTRCSLVIMASLFFCTLLHAKPQVSIITSVFDGDEFIEGFLEDITKQTLFNQCELIMINANSPGNEETIIKRYVDKYPNIRYIKLEHDPGLYAVWNMAIKMSHADFITPANLDDRRHTLSLAMHAFALQEDPTIDLVYADYYITQHPNETFSTMSDIEYRMTLEFNKLNAIKNCALLPGPQPMWRKSMHEACGFFDETFVSAGDWELWLRAVSKNITFKKIPGIFGLYYKNPNGLSTPQDPEKFKQCLIECTKVIKAYDYLWQ